MELISEEKSEPRVRIIIGRSEKKQSGVKKPIKVITLINTSVDEVYKKIKEMIENE